MSMSKGRKSSKVATDASWDVGLVNDLVDDDTWRSCLVFLSPDHVSTQPHLEALVTAADGGNRRRFAMIDRDTLLQSAREDAKLTSTAGGGGKKQSSAAPGDRPQHVEVCEHVVSALSSGGGVPAPLVARMLKYKVLRKRSLDLARKEAIRKEAEEATKPQKPVSDTKGGKKAAGSGRTSKAAGGKKDAQAVDVSPAVPIPQKPPTSMKKRGEEDLDSKYIDDEPKDGPDCYFLLTGFSSAEIFQHLSPVKLTAHALVQVVGQEPPPPEQDTLTEEEQLELQQRESSLFQFWSCIRHVIKATPSGSMLRDTAQLELTVTQSAVPSSEEEKAVYGQSLFDILALQVFHMLQQYKQYHHYITYLDVQSLPLMASESPQPEEARPISSSAHSQKGSPSVGMRYYRELLSAVPEECSSIPLILHCMVEQVSATLSTTDPAQDSQNPDPMIHPAIMAEVDSCISSLAIPSADKKELVTDEDKLKQLAPSKASCTIIAHSDSSKQRTFHLKDSKILKISEAETTVNHLSSISELFNAPVLPHEEMLKQSVRSHALEHFCVSAEVSPRMLDYALVVLSLEHTLLPSASQPQNLSSITQNGGFELLFDYPYSIPMKEISQSEALVPYSAMESADVTTRGVSVTPRYTLDLPLPLVSLEDYAVCEYLTKDVLLQLLQSLQSTHPYVKHFYHRHSKSVVVIAHTGFDGNPIHEYQLVSQAHSKVGFHNYLQFAAGTYGDFVDKAVLEDAENRKQMEEQRQLLVEEKLKTIKEDIQTPPKEEPTRLSGKSSKRDSATSSAAKKTPSASGKKSSKECTPAASTLDVVASEVSLPEIKEQKLFLAYDVGDKVLLNKSSVSTQFMADGAQIRTEKLQPVESPTSIKVSLLDNGHSLSVHMKLKEEGDTSSVNDTEYVSEKKEGGEDNESESQEVVQPVAGTPQPPQSVSFASLQASFQKGLTLTLSHYGPNGNGELPFEPEKPLALQQPSRAQSSSSSRPQSQQSTSPQKMSKKQQEQMQQQLEQQKLLEEQQARERKVLEKKYQQECTAILRHNKYQQLFASTSCGLHSHCQVMVDLEADPSLTDGSDGHIVIRQSYPVKGSGTQKCEEVLLQAALTERKRCYLPDGSVVRFMLDKSVVILCADGSVYRTASLSETELYKNTIPTDQAPQDDQTSQIALEVSERVLSAAKVTFADEQDKAIEETSPQAIWVVTTPTGERYLWKKEDVPTNKEELVEDKDEGQTEEDHVATESTVAPEETSVPVSRIVPLTPIQTFPATDPVTKEVLITREDNVILLYHPAGSHVVEHADGTRFTTHWSDEVSDKIPSEVVIECAGFARVIYYQSQRQCKVDFPDHSKILCSTDGSYIISKPNDYTLHIAPNGEAKYTPGFQQEQAQIEQQSSGTYTLDHTGCSDILVTRDTLGNQFSVSAAGEISVLPSSTDMKVPPHAAFTPRYFVLQEDGTCYEMVQSKTADAVIAAAESNRKAIVIRDTQFSEPNSTSTTIIEPYEVGSNSLPYMEESIIPENLRTVALSCQAGGEQKQTSINGCTHKRKFGVGVGKALMIGSYHKPPPQAPFVRPNALKYRQFVHVRPVCGETREEVYSGLTRYLTWCREQERGGEDLQPVDERTDSEKQVARELQSRWNQDISDKVNIPDSELSSKYIQLAVQQPSCEVIRSSERVGMKAKYSEGIKKELEDTEAAKIALREHKVMPYFESMEYLRAKSPDMEELASKLAKPKQPTDVASTEALVSKQAHSSCSTPSTLHSASMTLPPGGEVASPVPSEATGQLGPVGSLSKLRPSNPTPDHAHGNGTPTDIRPTNPTPSHALKAAPVNTTEEISVSTSTEDVQTSLTTSTNVTMDMTTSSTEDTAPTRPENPTPVEAYLGPNHRPTSQSSFMLPQPSSSVGNTTVSFTLPQPESDHHQENSIEIARSQEEVTKGFSKPHGSPLYISTYTDVTGKTRTLPVKAPSSIQGGRPGEQCNIKFATVEDPVRRKVHSSSVTSTAIVVRGFDVLPERVEFGVLKEGCTYASTVTLKNTGIDSCRFKIKQPPPSTGIKVIYIPGPVAAGLSRSFDVEIFAMAVGVVGECGEGCVEHDLEIVTETSILHLPIKATVLTGAAYGGHPSEDREAPGVRVIADRPLSRESLTRPPKTL